MDEDNFQIITNVKYLHSKGIRLGLNVNPLEGFYPYERNYEQLKEHLLEDETGKIPFNVFDSKTIDVYLTMLIHPLDDMDVDFYWLDNDDTKKLGESFLLNHYHFYDMMRIIREGQ